MTAGKNANDQLKAGEFILTAEGRVYHLNVRGEEVAGDVVLVGDPDRVETVASFFEKIEFESVHREFRIKTGYYCGKRITVVSTGIGTDNIDIVLNELDAAVNIDPATRRVRSTLTKLNLYRIGTCGGLQPEMPVDTFVLSDYGIGLDCLMNYYEGAGKASEHELEAAFIKHMAWPERLAHPYCFAADTELAGAISRDGGYGRGITATATGFYGPQGRVLRLATLIEDLTGKLQSFTYGGMRIVNFEMETAALYGLSALLGHRSVTMCVVIANRSNGGFSDDYRGSVKRLCSKVLNDIVQI